MGISQASFQAQVEVHEGTPPESQRLVFRGATMQDRIISIIILYINVLHQSLSITDHSSHRKSWDSPFLLPKDDRSLTSYGPRTQFMEINWKLQDLAARFSQAATWRLRFTNPNASRPGKDIQFLISADSADLLVFVAILTCSAKTFNSFYFYVFLNVLHFASILVTFNFRCHKDVLSLLHVGCSPCLAAKHGPLHPGVHSSLCCSVMLRT